MLDDTATIDLAGKLEFLRRPQNYPDRPARVETIETHMSWVFLTERFAYKLKKPVRLAFLDFSTLAARKHACDESLRLNARLAGDVYVGVVALRRRADGELSLDGDGEPVEWLEKMRRLPAERMLDRAIAAGTVDAEHVRRFSRVLAAFYRARACEPISPEVYRARLSENIEDDHAALIEPAWQLPRARLIALRDAQRHALERHAAAFDARVEQGHVVEGHGDLRPEHVCLIDPPVIIDCLEFNASLRILDAADELAYLALECEHLGAPWIGPLVFDIYSTETGDRPPPEIVAFYKAHRAVLRAKLAVWHLRDHPPATHARWLQRTRDYLALADRYAL
jgi:aminoglycoside phosphotransferase family enzyme